MADTYLQDKLYEIIKDLFKYHPPPISEEYSQDFIDQIVNRCGQLPVHYIYIYIYIYIELEYTNSDRSRDICFLWFSRGGLNKADFQIVYYLG